jgi:hypothetical protein
MMRIDVTFFVGPLLFLFVGFLARFLPTTATAGT